MVFLALAPGSLHAGCGTQQTSGSRWEVQTDGGVSWLVNPCGERFFSIGVNTLVSTSSPPILPQWVPEPKVPESEARRTAARLAGMGLQHRGLIQLPKPAASQCARTRPRLEVAISLGLPVRSVSGRADDPRGEARGRSVQGQFLPDRIFLGQ